MQHTIYGLKRKATIRASNGLPLPANPQAKARLQFVDWLKELNPSFAEAVIQYAEQKTGGISAPGLGQIVGPPESGGGSFWEKIVEGAASLGITYLTLKNQRDAMQINLDRAQVGLPPIDVATSAPVIRTQVDIDPELAAKLASNVGSSINTGMLWLAAGGVALFFFLR